MMSTPALFPLPAQPPLRRAEGLRAKATGAPVSWARYRPRNRVACDECVLVLHEARGAGPYPRASRWRRTQQGADPVRLCNEHADAWRKDEK